MIENIDEWDVFKGRLSMTSQSSVYQLEMAFIPNPEVDPHFFLWMTDADGRPVSLPFPVLKSLLYENEWTRSFTKEGVSPFQMVISEEDIIEVTGMAVDMVAVFHALTHMNAKKTTMSHFIYGESFNYWTVISQSLAEFIKQGQYFPVLFSLVDTNRRCLIAHWMLSRQTIEDTRVFYQWLQLAPSTLFSFVDMGSLSINDWQNLLLDTWINQIIRSDVNVSTYDDEKKEILSEVQDIRKLWQSFLIKPSHIGLFYVPDDPETMKEVRKLERDIELWHRPLSGKTFHQTKKVLAFHLKSMMTSGFKPHLLKIVCKPDSIDDPFHPYHPWHVKLSVDGLKDGEHDTLTGKDMTTLSVVNKSWLSNKLDQLIMFSDEFGSLSHGQSYAPYETTLGLTTVLWLQKQRDVLQKLSIYVDIPTNLDWRSIDEDEVAIDLSIGEGTQQREERQHAQTPIPSHGSLSLHSLIDFDWRIAIGDLSLSFVDFKHLVETQQRMIFHRNEWVELPLERMSEAYDEMRLFEADVFQKQPAMNQLLHVYIKSEDRKTRRVNLKMKDQVKSYLERLVSKPTGESQEIPEQLVGELRPYQKVGYQWFCDLYARGVGGCLADDMGLGKTIQAIAYLLYIKKELDQQSHLPSLIICPTSVIENWKRELSKFAPSLNVAVHHGPNRSGGETFYEEAQNVDIMITSYHLFVRDNHWFLNKEWHTVFLDEAQMIKNHGTKQSQAVRKLRTRQRFALTGTPMENKLDELWSIMDFLNKGYLGSLAHFRSYFITPIEKHGDEERLALVRRLVHPFLLRRTKNDPKVIQDLPNKSEEKAFCYLTKEQASLYQSVVERLMQQMQAASGIERKGLILASITRLKQVCNHPMFLTNEWDDFKAHRTESPKEWLSASGKLNLFFEILEPIINKNEKCLVFTQYVKTGQLLIQAIKEINPTCHVYFLYGGIPSEKRTELIEGFRQLHGQPAVFILSLKAGGVGLNLTEANHVIHYDRWWNPAVENQATDRAYRIGQQRHVHVHKLISKGTLEEGIDQLIEKKKWLTDQVIGQGDQWITEMTDNDVYELVRLKEKVTS